MHQRPNGDELERREQAFRARQKPEHNEAETEIISLGQSMQTTESVGESQQADRAGKEEKDAGADRRDTEQVDENSSAVRSVRILDGRTAVHEGGGGEGREQRKPEGDILDPARAGRRGDQQERTNSPSADELSRHQAIGVARAAEDAHQPYRHSKQDDARRREKKISQSRPPG